MGVNEKTKQRLIAGSLIALALVAVYLLLRKTAQEAAAPAANGGGISLAPGGGVSLGGTNYGAPGAITGGSSGGNTFNIGGVTVPGLAGVNIPGVNVPQLNFGNDNGTPQSCCSSCGCDPNSGVNSFSTSIADTLNSYAGQISGLESNYVSQLFGSLGPAMAQYVATSDLSAPGGLNG